MNAKNLCHRYEKCGMRQHRGKNGALSYCQKALTPPDKPARAKEKERVLTNIFLFKLSSQVTLLNV
jgi:hypothetical protein